MPDTDEADILDYVKFGFPLGYLGPASHTDSTPNHDSAIDFPDHVDSFVDAETRAGVMIGPFNQPPFTPWVHVSPVMSRPKADPSKRRVITDPTFPKPYSINTYIMKNSALGEVRDHTLPTVADLVAKLRAAGTGSYMFIVDIACAYRNFLSDPLDWPLLCIFWRGQYQLDVTMPFGARASSYFMQRVANFITRVLREENITAIMYLDDIVVVALDKAKADRHYDRVKALLAELGLTEAIDKSQPPSTSVTLIGINVDACAMTLSIPQDKL